MQRRVVLLESVTLGRGVTVTPEALFCNCRPKKINLQNYIEVMITGDLDIFRKDNPYGTYRVASKGADVRLHRNEASIPVIMDF